MSDSEFGDAAVPLPLLRQRAFNLRWAEQPSDVIPLTAADSDFPVSAAVRQQLAQYAADGLLGYGPPDGLPEYRSAVAEWFGQRRGVDCGSEAVLATDGAAAAMAAVARASLRPGEQVLIPDPVDFLFAHTVAQAGAVPVRVPYPPATTADEYVAALAERLSPDTRMLWLCNPHNPRGTVPGRDWLAQVVEWAVGHGLRILSDEVWADITYPPHRCTSVAALSPHAARHTATVYGFSKNFGLAGLRIGAVVCPDRQWRESIVAAADTRSTVSGASVLSQVAAVAAMRDGQDWLAGFLAHLHRQRDFLLERLSRWPATSVTPPQGTYVAFVDLSALDPDAEHLCQLFLEKGKVALVPGSPRWFGPGGAGHVRLSFATSRAILAEALDRLEREIEALSSNRRPGRRPRSRPRPGTGRRPSRAPGSEPG